jgi:hypothetical protein
MREILSIELIVALISYFEWNCGTLNRILCGSYEQL